MITYLLQADIDMRHMASWSAREDHPDSDRALHALVYRTFGAENVPRAFAANADTDNPKDHATLLAYTGLDTPQLQEVARTNQDLALAGVMSPYSFRTKELPDTWRQGSAVGFQVRLIPTYRTNDSGAELDVHRRGDAQPTRQGTYCRWAAELLKKKAGADPAEHTLHVTKLNRRTVQRQRGQMATLLPDVTVQGSCILEDTEAWENALRFGIGRHKAYGYGMLLLRPVR